MDEPYEIFKAKVWQFLDTMQPGYNYEISKICIPENRFRFIYCIKAYMNATYPFQGYLSFNKDYTIIYKAHPFIVKK